MAIAKVALLSTGAQSSSTPQQPFLVQAKVHSSRNPRFWLQGCRAIEYPSIKKQMILERTETR